MCFEVLGMVMSAAGTITGMQAQSAQAEYQAQIAERNAKIAEQQAKAEAEKGAQEQQMIQQNVKATAGAQRAAFSANGLDIGAGSALDVLSDTSYLGELDVATSRFNTANRTWALNNQALDYRDKANAARIEGKNARTATLLSGLSSLASQYASFSSGGSKPAGAAGSPYSRGVPSTASLVPSYDGAFFNDGSFKFTNPMIKKQKSFW